MDITSFDLGIVGDALGLSASAVAMIFLDIKRASTPSSQRRSAPSGGTPRLAPAAAGQKPASTSPPRPAPEAPRARAAEAGSDIRGFQADIQDLSSRFDLFEERWRTEMTAMERSLEGAEQAAQNPSNEGGGGAALGPEMEAIEAEGRQLEGAVREAEERLRRIQGELHALSTRPAGDLTTESYSSTQELVFGISHQLRTPLAIVRSVAESSIAAGWLGSQQRHAFQTILQSVEMMNRRLEELVQFSKPVPLNLQAVDLREFLEKVVLLVDEACRKAGILHELKTPPSMPRLNLDPYQFQVALLHLLFNAIEAMPKGGGLLVEAAWDEAEGTATVRVKDSGVGITPDQFAEVQPFFSTKPGGTGLGLCIARRVCQAHGGDLRISSNPGKGTEVVCSDQRGLRGKWR